MAVWQFKLEGVPSSAVVGRDSVSEDEWNESQWWEGVQPSETFLTSIAGLLPTKDSWSEELRQWGRQDSDLVEIWYEDNLVESVLIRLDSRQPNIELIEKLLKILSDSDYCMIHSRDRRVLPNNFVEFVHEFENSPSYKVVSNPEVWLPKMAKDMSNKH